MKWLANLIWRVCENEKDAQMVMALILLGFFTFASVLIKVFS
jgi:hypothetical protein